MAVWRCALCATVATGPISPAHAEHSDRVSIESRVFWIGPAEDHDYWTHFGLELHRIDWIAELLETDAILRARRFTIDTTGRRIILRDLERADVEEIPPEFRFISGGVSLSGSGSYRFQSERLNDRWEVRCGWTFGLDVDACAFIVSYPPDVRITLEATVPMPDASLHPTFLIDAVARMREIAGCLDVTDRPEAQVDPSLETCR